MGQSLQLSHARLSVALVGLEAAQDLGVIPHAPEEGPEALELVGSEAPVETAASHLGSAKQHLYRGVPPLGGVRGREGRQHPLPQETLAQGRGASRFEHPKDAVALLLAAEAHH